MGFDKKSIEKPMAYKNAVSEDVFPRIVSINLLCVPNEVDVVVKGFKPVLNADEWFC